MSDLFNECILTIASNLTGLEFLSILISLAATRNLSVILKKIVVPRCLMFFSVVYFS